MSRFLCALLVTVFGCSQAVAGNPPVLGAELQSQLKAKYPALKVAKWCDGKVIGRVSGAAVMLQNVEESNFTVVWVAPGKEIQELDSVSAETPDDFELQCLSPREAVERESTLRHSEGIVNFLKVPAAYGAVCYFVEETTAKCWSLDRKTGRLKEVGGWQT